MIRRLVLAACLAAAAFPAAAQPVDREKKEAAAEQQLQQLRQQIKAITAEQRKLDGERSEASKSLREADALVGDAVRRPFDIGRSLMAGAVSLLGQPSTTLPVGEPLPLLLSGGLLLGCGVLGWRACRTRLRRRSDISLPKHLLKKSH